MTPQLVQPNGTPFVQASRGTKFVFSAAYFCIVTRQSAPKPTNMVGEERVLPATLPCAFPPSAGEVAPPKTFIAFSLLFAPTKNTPVFQVSCVTEPTTNPLREVLS